jgi:hypothetical protein
MLVRENGRGVCEVDSMLPAILFGLLWVPFEHAPQYMYACAYSASSWCALRAIEGYVESLRERNEPIPPSIHEEVIDVAV